ncbi:MAG: hypothetical protein ABGY42_14065 [bacterium]
MAAFAVMIEAARGIERYASGGVSAPFHATVARGSTQRLIVQEIACNTYVGVSPALDHHCGTEPDLTAAGGVDLAPFAAREDAFGRGEGLIVVAEGYSELCSDCFV